MAAPKLPTITFTRQRTTLDGLSTRNINTQSSPSGSPVFDVSSMCNPTAESEKKTSPQGYQPQAQLNNRGYGGYQAGGYQNGGYQAGGYQTPAYPQPSVQSPIFRSGGQFAGLPYADVTDKNVELVKAHDRMGGTLTPYVCGNVCHFDWDYVKWFNATFKRSSITLCTKCPYTVLIANTKFPKNDPTHPSATFNEVWESDREYFRRMPETPHYANLRWLYERRSRRFDGFPMDMQRCKHAGKSFEEVLNEAPQYFQWITFNYSGNDEVYLDAMDWWSENKERAPLPNPVEGVPVIALNTEGVPEGMLGSPTSASVVDTTKFTNGKHRNKTMFQVAVYDPEYFDWLENKCQSRDPVYQGAVEWFKVNYERIRAMVNGE